VLLTGAAGFLGIHFVHSVAALNVDRLLPSRHFQILRLRMRDQEEEEKGKNEEEKNKIPRSHHPLVGPK
jgi:nucleoside-diphosphate-sugar epimerase